MFGRLEWVGMSVPLSRGLLHYSREYVLAKWTKGKKFGSHCLVYIQEPTGPLVEDCVYLDSRSKVKLQRWESVRYLTPPAHEPTSTHFDMFPNSIMESFNSLS